MNMKLFYITLLIGFNLFGQEIYIDAESNYYVNKDNEELLLFKNDSVSIYDLNSFHLLEKKEIISPPNFDFSVYHILDKEPIHFVEINGGKVYQLNNDTNQRMITRIPIKGLGIVLYLLIMTLYIVMGVKYTG